MTDSTPAALSLPLRRERRDAAAHRQRILAVAQQLFAESSVAAVSMHQIAQTAGIGQGTLYRRYANKGALCKDLLHERHTQLEHSLRGLLAATSASPALERLSACLRLTMGFMQESMGLLEAIMAAEMRELACNGPLQHQHTHDDKEQWFLWLHRLFADLLAEAVAHTEIAPLDTAYTADIILATMNPLMLRFQMMERGYSSERILTGLQRLFVTGLRQS
jgi:AcrR family transcriptional regulator